jgi:hypothetical protein
MDYFLSNTCKEIMNSKKPSQRLISQLRKPLKFLQKPRFQASSLNQFYILTQNRIVRSKQKKPHKQS